MYLAIITLPLLGSIAAGFLGRKLGISGAQFIASTSVIVTTILAIFAFVEVGLNNIAVSINLIRWIDSESLNVLWGFQFDSLTVSMLIPVLIVSSLVHVYSVGYMSHDPHPQRFFSYLSLFTFMMIILVTANNYLLMFVGWEGVGVCSYLLVSFWFTRIAANQSSISAFLTNRVGDCFLTIGMFALLWSFGNVDYSTVFSLAPFVNENLVTIIGICLLIGAMAKSSQVGLHVWLPMAMEGPTPVSALIHAATMVTAGVYLLIRSSPLIEYSSTVLLLCLWLGAITTVFSSLIGLFQQDIKKVIAYSTMSQLGMMVIAVGLSSYNVALFHLVNHAFYKALLFLGAGSVIHAVADNQDFRKYGGLRAYLPLTYSVMLIASLSLVAFPFMTGFYSKDFILESAYGEFYFSGAVVYYIATTGAIFTTLYSVKVLYLTFLTNPNGPLVNYKSKNYTTANEPKAAKEPKPANETKSRANDGDMFMSLPLIILAIFSIFFGYITKEIFIGLGSAFFADNSVFVHSIHEIMLDTEFAVSTVFKLLPFTFTILFSILAIIISEFFPNVISYFKLSRLGYNIFGFFNQRFFIELLYNRYISGLLYYKLGGQTTMVIDKGAVELLGPFGLEKILTTISRIISNMSRGVITNYALYILMGLILYISFYNLTSYDNSLFIVVFLALLSILNSYKSNIINNNTSHVLESSIVCGTSDISGWFGTTIKTKIIKVSASSGFYVPKAKNIPATTINNTSSDLSGSNHVSNNITNYIDNNSVLSNENIAKYKEAFDAVRGNLDDITRQKLDLINPLCNETKLLEKFNTLYPDNIADKVSHLFNSCCYNDMSNILFNNHFVIFGLTIIIGSSIITFFSTTTVIIKMTNLLDKLLAIGLLFKDRMLKIFRFFSHFILKTNWPQNPTLDNSKSNIRSTRDKANYARNRARICARKRAYMKKKKDNAPGGGGDGGDDPNKKNGDKDFYNWVSLVEILITLLASLTLILASITNNLAIPDIDIATVGNALTYITNNMEYIYSDHPEFGSQYRELINGWTVALGFLLNNDLENATGTLGALINILSGILDYIHPNCVDLIDTGDISSQLS